MTNLRDLQIVGPNDAFGRVRVSDPETILEEKNVSVSPVLGNNASGGGSATRSVDRASFLLETNGVDGAVVYRQSRQRAIYQPGKSQEWNITFVGPGDVTNVIWEVGIFDDNNGLFLRNAGGSWSFVIRTSTSGSPTETVIPRASWDDQMDGNGPSGVNLDLTKAQIFIGDFQWLGVGTVRFGFSVAGENVFAYANDWSNIGDVVYMSNPNLPIRWRIEQSGAASATTLEAICGMVASEGGFDKRGLSLAFGDGAKTAINGDETELLAVRLNGTGTPPGTEIGIAFLERIKILCTSNANYRYKVYLNDDNMSGGTWTTPTGSFCEFATDRTGTPGGANAVEIDRGYGTTSNDETLGDIISLIGLGYDVFSGAADVLSLTVQRQTGSQNETFEGTMVLRLEA